MELARDFYVGLVEDNKDPNRKGRVKIRVQTLYHNIPVEDIPYAYPWGGIAGKDFQVPAIGKLVNVLFLSDDLYSPYYIYSENYNINLQNKLKSLNDEEYVNFTSLLFDESTQIFIKGKELTIDQLLNKVTINNTSINLELKDNTQKLNLASKGADQDAVLGTNFFQWMDNFINELSKPGSLIDSNGAAIIKPRLNMLCSQYKLLRPNFVSNYVKIADNGKVKILSRNPDVINNKNDIDLVIPPDINESNRKILNDAIKAQNDKACETLKNAAPTDQIDLNDSARDPNAINLISSKKTKSKIDNLHPDIKPYVIAFINKCKASGFDLEITSGYRSIAYQQSLQKTGNAAKPGFSYHNYGLAIDVKPSNNKWGDTGEIAESLGFRWGIHFKNPKSERWHYDMSFGFSTTQLKNKFDQGDVLNGYVNLGPNTQVPTTNNQLNGQNYSINPSSSVSKPCEGMKAFNRSDADQNKSNSNNKSDESESAPTKEEEERIANLSCIELATKILLDRIAKGEGATDTLAAKYGFNSAYDITYSYGKYTPDYIGSKQINPITSLTLGELKQVQHIMLRNGSKSTSMGKYQIVLQNIPDIQQALNMDDNTLFSPDTQDKMAYQLLRLKRGYDNWLNGSISDDNFQENLAKEWSSIASPTNGRSYYGQHVGTSDDEIKEVMSSTKKQMNQCT